MGMSQRCPVKKPDRPWELLFGGIALLLAVALMVLVLYQN
jgi:hypothetical protein